MARNSAVLVSARLVTGLVGVGVAVVTVGAATLLPLPTVSSSGGDPDASGTRVTPVAAGQQLVCPGPVLRLGDTTGADASTANTVGRTDVTRAATRGTPALESLESTDNPENTPPTMLVLPPVSGEDADVGADQDADPGDEADAEPGILSGGQSQRVGGTGAAAPGDLVGFAATRCASPAAETWLVGGSTTTGRTTLLLLANPSSVIATVDLRIYTADGILKAAGTDGIVIPPRGQRVFSLAGFAPDTAHPVVHVTSTGGRVVAGLQQSIVRTLDPGGVDMLAGGSEPATDVVIPGVVLSGHEEAEAMLSAGDYEDVLPVLRLLVPGEEATDVRVTVYPEADAEDPGDAGPETEPRSVTISVDPGVVTDFPLGDFADGNYTLRVSAGEPVVAAVRASVVALDGPVPTDPTTPGALAATDFAWFGAAPALRAEGLLSVAPGPGALLHLMNPEESETTVTLDDGRGSTTVTVPGDGAVAVALDANRSYRLSGFGTVHASVSYAGAGALAGYVASPPEALSRPIVVWVDTR
jgi:hypothetical protein